MKISWTGFSKKSLQERLQILKDYHLLNEDNQTNLEHNHMLPLSTADQMSENVLATFALPYSFVPDVVVDEEVYQVPFVTEEPLSLRLPALQQKLLSALGASKRLFTIAK